MTHGHVDQWAPACGVITADLERFRLFFFSLQTPVRRKSTRSGQPSTVVRPPGNSNSKTGGRFQSEGREPLSLCTACSDALTRAAWHIRGRCLGDRRGSAWSWWRLSCSWWTPREPGSLAVPHLVRVPKITRCARAQGWSLAVSPPMSRRCKSGRVFFIHHYCWYGCALHYSARGRIFFPWVARGILCNCLNVIVLVHLKKFEFQMW